MNSHVQEMNEFSEMLGREFRTLNDKVQKIINAQLTDESLQPILDKLKQIRGNEK